MAVRRKMQKKRGRTSPVMVMKKKDARTEDTLLTATAELLTEKRSLDFSLAEVAARTGLSAALVQYYFGSKHGLLGALLEWSSSRYVAQINNLMAMSMPAMDKLRIHVRALIKTYTKTPYIDRLLHHVINASDDAEAKRISSYYVGRVVEFYRHLIDQGVSEGTMRPIDPMHLYFVLLGTGDHLAARRRLLTPALGVTDMDAQFAQEFGEALFDILSNGLRKR
jgi:TetR/AcrR family transcriptional regulator